MLLWKVVLVLLYVHSLLSVTDPNELHIQLNQFGLNLTCTRVSTQHTSLLVV